MEFYPPSVGMVPHKYVLVSMNGKLAILAGWYGGYTSGSSWRRSTDVVKVEESTDDQIEYIAYTRTGSQYILMKGCYGYTGYTSSVYESMSNNVPEGESLTAFDEIEALNILKALKNKPQDAQLKA